MAGRRLRLRRRRMSLRRKDYSRDREYPQVPRRSRRESAPIPIIWQPTYSSSSPDRMRQRDWDMGREFADSRTGANFTAGRGTAIDTSGAAG
jgi:hypothetical protein